MNPRSVFQSEVIAGTCVVTPLRQISEFSEESVLDELEIVQDEYRDCEARHVVFDLKFIKQLSSAMLEILLRFRKLTKEHQGQVACCNVHPSGLDALKLSRFDTFLTICETREQALERMQ